MYSKLTIFTLLALAILPYITMAKSSSKSSSAENDDAPDVYKGVKDGCKLIKCTNGTFCGIRNGTVKFGERPFETFLFPKCVKNASELSQNTENDGNSQLQTDGPGCDMVQCVQGYQCQVRVSISKLGNLPYAQSISGFPQCVTANQTYKDPSTVIVGGPGCDKLGPCSNGTQCIVATGIAKYGDLPWSQFFWPFCA